MRSVLNAALAAAAIAVATPAAAHPDDAALNAVYDRLAAAQAANDVAAMAAIFSRDGLLVDSRTPQVVSGGELEAVLRPQAQQVAAGGLSVSSRFRVERRSVTGGLAIDTGYISQTVARPDGQAMTHHSRFLVTMRREGGVWRIVADANMPATEEAWNDAARSEGLKFDG